MNWLKQLVSRRRQYRDLSDEMAEHLQEKIEELISSGMPRHEAEAAARRQFGNALLLEERGREVWQWALFDAVLRDLKYAFRQLRRNPGFTVTVLLTLSVAIRRQHRRVHHAERTSASSTSLFSAGTTGLVDAKLPHAGRSRDSRQRRRRDLGTGS